VRLQDVFQGAQLRFFLVLNEPGSSSTSPSRLPRMFVRTSLRGQHARFEAGGQDGLHHVWPVLKSLPQMVPPSRSPISESLDISTVRLGAPLPNGWPLVMAPRRTASRARSRVIGLHAFYEFLWGAVHVFRLQEHFGGTAPQDYQARELLLPS